MCNRPQREPNPLWLIIFAFLAAAILVKLSGTAFPADTYLFRASIRGRTPQQARAVLDKYGKDGDRQPFHNTHVLLQADTNYVLIKITPKDGAGDTALKTYFSAPGFDLYQVYRVNDYGEPTLVQDNSASFPVNFDWSVKRSTP